MKRAFISWGGGIESFTPHTLEEVKLKIATLFYDEIVFQVFGSAEGFVESWAESNDISSINYNKAKITWLTLQNIEDRNGNKKVIETFWEQAENEAFDQRGKIRHGMKMAIYETIADGNKNELNKIIRSRNDPALQHEMRWTARGAYMSAIPWLWLNQTDDYDFISYYPAEQKACELKLKKTLSMGSFETVINHTIPNFGELEWNDIFDLKLSNEYFAFKEFISNFQFKDKMSLERYVTSELFNLSSEFDKSIGTAVIDGLLSNIPFIPINPYSIFNSARKIVKTRNYQQDFGWLIFLHIIKKKTE